MSDYLARLVERSFGRSEAVRPRPLAQFERLPLSPMPPPAPLDTEAPAEAAPPPTALRPRPAGPAPAPAPRMAEPANSEGEVPQATAPAPPDRLRPRERERSQRPKGSEVPEPSTGRRSPPVPSPVPGTAPRSGGPPVVFPQAAPALGSLLPPGSGAPAAPPARITTSEPSPLRARPGEADGPPVVHTPRVAADATPAAPPPPPEILLQPVRRAPLPERPRGGENLAAVPDAEAAAGPAVASARVVPAPAADLLRPVPASSGRASEAVVVAGAGAGPRRGAASVHAEPVATPTISVTIGRLEVRASPPSPPSATPSRRDPPAVMSLDEYLKQRASGSRP